MAIGCGCNLAPGQKWSFCGETDGGRMLPVLCLSCGGTYQCEPTSDNRAFVVVSLRDLKLLLQCIPYETQPVEVEKIRERVYATRGDDLEDVAFQLKSIGVCPPVLSHHCNVEAANRIGQRILMLVDAAK